MFRGFPGVFVGRVAFPLDKVLSFFWMKKEGTCGVVGSLADDFFDLVEVAESRHKK